MWMQVPMVGAMMGAWEGCQDSAKINTKLSWGVLLGVSSENEKNMDVFF